MKSQKKKIKKQAENNLVRWVVIMTSYYTYSADPLYGISAFNL